MDAVHLHRHDRPGQGTEVQALDGLGLSAVDDFFVYGPALQGLFVAGG